ncbi:MAG: M14 family zinc carboxypeptidase, partial [Fidelibacterota bacterium]
MYKTYLKLLTIFLSTGFLFSQAPIEHYLKIYIQDQSELEKLTKMVSISRAEKPVVFAYASHDQLAKLSASSFSFEHLPHPNESFFPEMAASLDELREWNRYPTYDQYVDQMISFQANYPDICSLESIGQSVDGREILFVKISDNVAIDEEEPEFMYSAQMHGNELIGFIVSLNLIEYLLENYGIDNQITNLIDNVEIWINPLANPDGTYYGGNHTVEGAIRFNANGVDLNRNYPDWVDGPHPDGNLWQPENIAMMNFAADHHFVLSSNIHSGAEVVNYPWDTTPVLTADDDWWQLVSHSYADTAQFYSPDSYFDGYDDGITNGWAWYEIDGGRQDYMNYYEHCREMTLELTNGQMISEDELSDYWEYNRAAMVNYIEEVLYGVTGTVTNSQGEAIEAIITIPDHDFDNSHVLTHPDFGTYYRLLSPGTYNILYESYSYESHLENNVVLGLHESVHLDIVLNP